MGFKVSKSCLFCGTAFEKPPSFAYVRYCSTECSHADMVIRGKARKNRTTPISPEDRAKYLAEMASKGQAAVSAALACHDCKAPYEQAMGMSLNLSREQWLLIAPDDGILCANCIVRRASKLPEAICLHATIKFAADY